MSNDPNALADAYTKVWNFIQQGQNIDAIKMIREEFGFGLLETKRLVERIIETHYPTKAKEDYTAALVAEVDRMMASLGPEDVMTRASLKEHRAKLLEDKKA